MKGWGRDMELNEIYQVFDEDKRLNQTNASSVEFLTVTRFIDRYLNDGIKILDIGAGTGVYSLHYAKKGFEVTAVEPVRRNLDCLISKITQDMKLTPVLGNALDLSEFEDESFDLVFCFGPMYHLKTEEEQSRCIEETKRVCKKNGKILFAYISNDMVFVTESLMYNPNFFEGGEYNRETFKLEDEPFTFLTFSKIKEIMEAHDLKKVTCFAADGLAELLSEKINALTKEQFSEWLRFHFYTCEKEELLGYSHHIVYVAENM